MRFAFANQGPISPAVRVEALGLLPGQPTHPLLCVDPRYADGRLYRAMFVRPFPRSAPQTCNHPPTCPPSSRTTSVPDLWGVLARPPTSHAISLKIRTGRTPLGVSAGSEWS